MEANSEFQISGFENSRLSEFSERFEILGELGRGGMSIVYKAREKLLDRVVALKLLNHGLLNEERMIQRFQNEAKACSLLQHPNIVQILSFGAMSGKQPFIVMEYLQGESLDEVLKVSGGLSKERFEAIFMPVMEALIYAHSKNIVHRDLKPSNIMVLADLDGNSQVKVVDFGIAKILEESEGKVTDATVTVGLLGSALYMSPEQCAGGKVDRRSDIYSLACVMYESIVGKPPFAGESLFETMYEHMKMSVPKLVEISGSLNIPKALFDAIIEALAKDPALRPQDMEQFQAKVTSALRRNDKIERGKAKSRAVRLALVCLLSLAFALVCAQGYFHFRMESKREQPPPVVLKKKAGRPPRHSIALLTESERLRVAGDLDGALKKCKEALSRVLLDNHDSIGLKREVFKQTANVYETRGEVELALKEHQKCIDLFLVGTSGRLEGSYNKSYYMMHCGLKEQGIKFMQNELYLAEKCLAKGDDDYDFASSCFNFGRSLAEVDERKIARKYLLKALSSLDGLAAFRVSAPNFGMRISDNAARSAHQQQDLMLSRYNALKKEYLQVLQAWSGTQADSKESVDALLNLCYRYVDFVRAQDQGRKPILRL